MSTETQKYAAPSESEPRHSALEEFSRDERRPAVLLLGGLAIAATFFAIGILVGRWSAGTVGGSPSTAPSAATTNQTPAPANLAPVPQPTATVPAAATNQAPRDAEHRFAVLVATYNTPEDAQPLIKSLEQEGYTNIRTSTPRADNSRPKFSVLVGHYTRDEAREAAARLRAASNPKFRNARVIEE
jgi:cell division septation protein DedD